MQSPHRSRTLRALMSAACAAALGAGLLAGAGASTATAATSAQEAAAGSKVIGYFTEWGTYDREYYVRNIETSGSADRLTHINYAFGNVTGGRCAMGDSSAATERSYTADVSVDGVADTYAKCGSEWWSYDTPATIAAKMDYKDRQGLAGTFLWELSGTTANGELIKAIR
nr:glycosyl hydrolase family 18 protein [Streptomyces sp. SM1]